MMRCAIYTRVSTDQGWNRTSIPWMPSMMPLSPISEAKPTPAGRWFDPSMTMAGSPVATRTALPCSGCWEDVRSGKIDVIVVYKVDRLTRSLADFAKLVELFDSTACRSSR